MKVCRLRYSNIEDLSNMLSTHHKSKVINIFVKVILGEFCMQAVLKTQIFWVHYLAKMKT